MITHPERMHHFKRARAILMFTYYGTLNGRESNSVLK